MTSRRSFVKKSLGIAAPLSLSTYASNALSEDVADALFQLNNVSPLDDANDEELWARLAQAYTVSASILNLNNGGVSPQPKVVQDAVD